MIVNNCMLPMEIFENEIFVEFQNDDLNNMRLVSKEFLKSIDHKSEFFYKSEDFDMKNSWKIINEEEKENIEKGLEFSPITAENLKNKRINLFEDYKKLKEILKTFDLIKDLFGGRKAFENLPILSLNNDLIEIKPKDMSAQIMRGQFKNGREFFVIRVKEISEKNITENDRQIQQMHPFLFKSDYNAKVTFCQLFFCGATVKELMELTCYDRSLKSRPALCGDILVSVLKKESSLSLKHIIKEGIAEELLYNFLKKFIRENGDNLFKIC